MSGIFLTMKRIPGGVAFVVAGALAVGGLSACGGGTAGKIRNLANGTTAKRIEKFQQRLETAQKLEYTAEYESKDSSGKTETIRVAQKPPKSLFSSGDTTIINDGTDTFTCTKSGGSSGSETQCIKTAGTGGNGSLAGFTQALSGAAVVGALSAAAIVPGIDAKESTRDLAGQHMDCVQITKSKENTHPEYCVTQDGILGYVADDSGNVFSMTSFKKSTSDSDFKPTGKVVTPEDLANQATSTTIESTTSTTEEATTSTTEEPTTDTSDTTDTTDTTTG